MATSAAMKNQLFLGTFIHSKKLNELEYLHDAAICVDSQGTIVAIEQDCDQTKAEETLYPRLGWSPSSVSVTTSDHDRKKTHFFFPGFIDTHLHAPQYPNVGIFGKSTLLDWLQKYTFPMESSMTSLQRANQVYTRIIRRTLSHGTTTASYFATIHVPATNLLADLCLAHGQRAFIGRVCMDTLGPEYYLDPSPVQAITDTLATIRHCDSIDPEKALVSPIITPRFAPACTSELLTELGKLRRLSNLPVQTHLSENPSEVALVRELFPDAASYTDVYDRHNLLGDRTVLAHAIHLSEEEADLVAARGSGVAHCPCSNSALASGECRVRWLLEKGVKVGLGTDMSGGYSPSILEAARQAGLVSRHVGLPGKPNGGDNIEEGEKARLSVEEVLYLATRGGADVMGLKEKIGGFEVGMEWDAQLVGLEFVEEAGEDEVAVGAGQTVGYQDDNYDGNVDIFGWETWEERVAKWLYNGDDRNTKKVWVKGRLVSERK